MKFSKNSLLALGTVGALGAVAVTNAFAPSTCVERALKTADIFSTALNGRLLNKLVDRFADKRLVDSNENLSQETKLYIDNLECSVTKGAATAGIQAIIGSIEDGGVGTNIDLETSEINLGWKKDDDKWVKARVAETTHEISPTWTTNILLEDDMTGGESSYIESLKDYFKSSFAYSLSRNEKVVAVDDSDLQFVDDIQARRILANLNIAQGESLPVTYNTDFNMQSDESFSRIFFQGIGAPLIADSDKVTDEYAKYGPFMVDMTFMGGLPLRSDIYKKYGARVHFDENQQVSAIYESASDKYYLPGDEGWAEAKMQAKVSVFTLCTVREHLAQSHLMVSNDASREIVKNLHPDHPIRRLLTIFEFNAVDVNSSAFQALVPENCFVHRASALSYEGLQAVFDNSLAESIAYKPFANREIKNPAVQGIIDNGRFPYVTEGKEYFEVVRSMVREWLAKAGDEALDEYATDFYNAMQASSAKQKFVLPEECNLDNMVDLISTVIFTVTGYHELIGHVPDYTDSSVKAGFRLVSDPKLDGTQVDVQSCILAAFIAASTSVKAPQLMAEFPNFIGAGGAPNWERDVWTKFQAELGVLSKKVQDADAARDFEFKYMDPSRFECSISV